MTGAEAVKARVPLLDYVAGRLDLKADGPRFEARCPFHAEKSASFKLYPEQDRWHCYGTCDQGGDVIDYAGRELYNGTWDPKDPEKFQAAIQALGGEPGTNTGPLPELTLAGFCERRKITPETLRRFGVREGTHKWRPALLWPTPVGVDRVKYLDAERPKYCWERKGGTRHIYGAKTIRPGEPAYLVNGECSVWACYEAGVPAFCLGGGEGSGLTDEMLARLTEAGASVVPVVYDRDATGNSGARAVAAQLRAAGIETAARELPEKLGKGGDVDDLHRWEGKRLGEALAALPELPAVDPDASLIVAGQAAGWEAPIPLNSFADLPTFPTASLPGWIGAFVAAESEATQTPPDLPGMMALATLAAAVAGKIKLLVRPGFFEPLNLYAVVSLPPGTRKSQVIADCGRPLAEWERSEASRLEPEIAAAETRRKIAEATLRKAETDAANAGPDARDAKGEHAARLARELATSTVPPRPRLLTDDCSPERLASLLCEQGGRMAILSAEGDVFELMGGRYSSGGKSGANFGVFLKAHAGDALRVDRVGRAAEHVPDPALTMGLAVQPDVIHGLADTPGFRGRGLLGRFLYAIPASTLGSRKVGASPVPDHIRAEWAANIMALLGLPDGTDEAGCRAPHIVTMAPEASVLLHAFEQDLEPRLGPYGELGDMTDWAGKLTGAVARIAAVLHLAELAGERAPWTAPVVADCVTRAIAIAEYLIPHARAAYASMGADPAVADARYLWGFIERRGAAELTRRDAFEWGKGRFERTERLDSPLAVLVERGYLREMPAEERTEKRGRPASQRYQVNPLTASHNSHNSQNTGRRGISANTANCAHTEQELLTHYGRGGS